MEGSVLTISEAQCIAMALRLLSLVLPRSLPKVNFCVGRGRLIEFEFLLGLYVQTGGRRAPTCQLVLGKESFFVFLAGGVRGCPSFNFSAQVAGVSPPC